MAEGKKCSLDRNIEQMRHDLSHVRTYLQGALNELKMGSSPDVVKKMVSFSIAKLEKVISEMDSFDEPNGSGEV